MKVAVRLLTPLQEMQMLRIAIENVCLDLSNWNILDLFSLNHVCFGQNHQIMWLECVDDIIRKLCIVSMGNYQHEISHLASVSPHFYPDHRTIDTSQSWIAVFTSGHNNSIIAQSIVSPGYNKNVET